MNKTTPQSLVVVGGGVIGTMHALEAVRRGWMVFHLERDSQPRGASVRNFGLIWVSGRAGGAELERALRARERWEEIGGQVPGIGFRPAGSLTLVRDNSELSVLEETVGRPDAGQREFRLLEPDEVRKLNPSVGGEILGALWCGRDAAVEPRLVPGAIREHLLATGRYSWLPGCQAVEIRPHGVRDQRGQWHDADLVVCCIGARPGGIWEEALAAAPLRRVRLQMLETEPFAGELPTALADGDSLRYYPAFEGPALAGLVGQDPLAASWHAQLLLVERLAGHLTVGDTHSYDEPFAFDISDAPYEHLLAVAEKLIGEPLPRVERRWAGVYSQVTDDRIYYRAELEAGVVVVTGPGGRGMTLSPAIAEETFR